MEYENTVNGYYSECTFDEFKAEWGELNCDNIPVFYHLGILWIVQPRKEAIYQIFIKDHEKHENKIKVIIHRGREYTKDTM